MTFHFDEKAEDSGCLFRALPRSHERGFAGAPFKLLPREAERILRPLFGWKCADGTRRYRSRRLWVSLPSISRRPGNATRRTLA